MFAVQKKSKLMQVNKSNLISFYSLNAFVCQKHKAFFNVLILNFLCGNVFWLIFN